MPTMYKLLTQDMTSHNDMTWEIDITNKATQHGAEMCSAQVLHCYASPEEAVLFNPIHASYKNPRLFEIETSEIINSDGLKHASKEQTLVKELELPVFTTEQKVKFGILCALEVCKADKFVLWASKWLSGEDRTKESAAAASRPVAADADAWSVYYAAKAAYAASAASAAADAAYYVAAAASRSAKVKKIDFKKIIDQM